MGGLESHRACGKERTKRFGLNGANTLLRRLLNLASTALNHVFEDFVAHVGPARQLWRWEAHLVDTIGERWFDPVSIDRMTVGEGLGLYFPPPSRLRHTSLDAPLILPRPVATHSRPASLLACSRLAVPYHAPSSPSRSLEAAARPLVETGPETAGQ